MRSLIDFVEGLREGGADFRSITEGIDTTTAAGRFFFHVLAALAQMERELIRERTHAGLAAARQRGRAGARAGASRSSLRNRSPMPASCSLIATPRQHQSLGYRAPRQAYVAECRWICGRSASPIGCAFAHTPHRHNRQPQD